MKTLLKSAWFIVFALCLFLTVGSVVNSISARSAQAEEISLETAEDESSQKLHQRRKTQKSSNQKTRRASPSVGRPSSAVAVVNNFSHPTERCRMNGFGGYLRN